MSLLCSPTVQNKIVLLNNVWLTSYFSFQNLFELLLMAMTFAIQIEDKLMNHAGPSPKINLLIK